MKECRVPPKYRVLKKVPHIVCRSFLIKFWLWQHIGFKILSNYICNYNWHVKYWVKIFFIDDQLFRVYLTYLPNYSCLPKH